MQNRHSKSYSNLKTQLEIDWEEERQALLEDQKKYRVRAQKLSNETNRRRKALEERRKEEEEKEQKFREQVLQQRKLKLQEATEKFQRGHLPPSQRRRTAYVVSRKPATKLDDAMEQIQGSFSSRYYYVPNRNHSNIRDTPSSLFSPGNGHWHKTQQPDSKSGCERISNEQKSNFSFDSNRLYFHHKLEEAQRLLEEHHFSNLQNFHQEVDQLAHSESLDSLDSLEEELDETEQTNILDDFTCENRYRSFSENTSYSVKNPARETESKCQHGGDHNGYLNSKTILFDQIPAANHLHSKNQMAVLDRTRHDATNSVGMGHNENIQFSSTQIQENAQKGISERKVGYSDFVNAERRTSHFMVVPAKAWATPDPTQRDTGQGSVVQENKETIQHPVISIKPAVTQPLATPVVHLLSEWECSASGCHNGVSTSSKNDINFALSTAGTEKLTGTNSAHINSMNNERIKCPDGTNQELLVHEKTGLKSSNDAKDFGDIHDQSSSSSSATLTPTEQEPGFNLQPRKARNNVSVMDGNMSLKSILKKASKYEYARTVGFKMLHFADTDGTVGLRDSVELTKVKETKRIEGKKLRWLDEMDRIANEKDGKGAWKPVNKVETKGRADNLSSISNQANSSVLTERAEPSSGLHSSVLSTGYHFTKHAWVNTQGVETNASEHVTRSLPKAKTKLVRRPKSARNQYTLTHRNKKGTIIRPQSATEASKILKSQGKVMVPHPPPRPASDSLGGQNSTDPTTRHANNETYQLNDSSNNVVTSSHVSAKDRGSTQGSAPSSGNMTMAQHYKAPEQVTKTAVPFNNDRPMTLKDSVLGSNKRSPIYGENGLRLDHTPTDEEIALLWQGVRSALNHKNTDFRPGDLSSTLQRARPNLSHVVIDGGTLLTNWKSFSRLNGVFSPSNNGYITLARRKQIADSSENKRRALLEQRKGRASSATLRNLHPQNLHNGKMNPFPTPYEPIQTCSTPLYNEVSESMAQFTVAENLVDTSATDGEILASMQAIQANRKNFGNPKVYGPGPSALSLEEQRLLQSLDRLNQRLQNVQDAIVKTPTAASGFPLKPTPNIQQLSSQPAECAAPLYRFRSLSADPRTRLQRRY